MAGLTPGSPEWRANARGVVSQEQEDPLGWWWLSFVDPERDKFLGVAVVEAHGVTTATLAAHLLGVNPGGQVMGIAIPAEHVPPVEFRNRLLTKAEAEAL